MRITRFVYSVDFKALNKKLVVIHNSRNPHTPVIMMKCMPSCSKRRSLNGWKSLFPI